MSSSPTYTLVDQFDEDEFPDIPRAPAALLAALNTVPDPRKPRGVRHTLPGILAIAACAVIAGARSFVAIAEWAAAATPVGLAKLGVTGDAPSESTFRRTITKLNGNGLDLILGAWVALREVNPKELQVIAVDGKSVRGSATGGDRCRHLLAAFTHISGLVLGQLDVALKTNEIPMFSTLLDNLELLGVLVTADALHCQKDHAKYLVEQRGAHYLLTVKGNQCATRRSDVYPPQAGGTRREVLGSDDSPGAERRRGQKHVRKPAAGSGCLGRRVGKTRTVWQRLDCLNPNLQRQQFTAAGTASVTGVRRGRGVMVRPGRPSRRKRCPVRALKEMSGVPAAVLDTYIGDERGITVPALGVGGDGVLVVVAGVTSGQGGRESRPQGEVAPSHSALDHSRREWRFGRRRPPGRPPHLDAKARGDNSMVGKRGAL